MVAVKMEPNIITYGTGNSACEKSRRWQWQPAVALLRGILIVKLTPVIITYGVVNSACEMSRRWQWQ